MFEDLDWKGAVKRATLAVGFYLLLIYVLYVAYPDSFGTQRPVSVIINAVLLFCLFAIFYAYTDRRRRRRQAQLRAEAKGKKPAGKGDPKAEGEEAQPSDLKGRHNPNTSRKKAARRRR